MEVTLSLGLLVSIFGVGVAVFLGFFFGYLFHWKSKFENQENRHKDQMSKLEEEHQRQLAGASDSTLRGLKHRTNLPIIRDILAKKTEDLYNLNIELGIQETSTVWSQLFRQSHAAFLRATSLIDPGIWEDEFMRKYAGEQRRLIDQLEMQKQANGSSYEEMVAGIRQKRGDELTELNASETNFERMFIVKDEQVMNSITLRKLAELISSQSGYMEVKAIHERKVATDDMKDFGVVISREGDLLVYELNIVGGTLHGGRVFFQPEKVTEFIGRYKRMRVSATPVSRNSTSAEVIDTLNEISTGSGTVIPEKVIEDAKKELGAHKCLYCFLSTEVALKLISKKDWVGLPADAAKACEKASTYYTDKDWKDLAVSERRWFEITDIENKKVVQYVTQNKPKRIIEVGCGPGRLISRITAIENCEYDEIVGIDGDEQMSDIAYQRFPLTQYPKVDIYHMRVKHKLPYPDDHFDLCINAMNIVGWQHDNEVDWLRAMMRYSSTTFFTVYKRGKEEERVQMYLKRPHRRDGVRVDSATGQIQLIDCATNPGVYSWAYEPNQVEDLCKAVASRYEPEYVVEYDIDDQANDLVYLCFISKSRK